MYLLTKLLVFVSLVNLGSSVCYFPVEYQGEFDVQLQQTNRGVHRYNSVTVLPDAIPSWGVCQKKRGDNVVLFDRTGGQYCMRCFNLKLRSPNIIQIHTESVDRCYTSEEEAMASCPSQLDISARRARQMMLYKTRTFITRDGQIGKHFCPINGQFRFTYNVNDGTENVFECSQSTSALANCPKSSELQIRFQRCTFGDAEMNLNCMGSWKGEDGQNYLALSDPAVKKEDKPKYRCAMYDIDEVTGVVHMSLSSDSSCTKALHSPWEGFETMVMTPILTTRLPSVAKENACTFPDWARAKWQNLEILQNDLILKDEVQDKVFQLECMSQHAPHGERYALFSRDQCGREEFTCIWIKKRDVNVIEFQISQYPSSHFNITQICADDVFLGQDWKTEGRSNSHQKVPSCPIQGSHVGVIPDNPDLCAKLVSDCNSPQKMHYTVSPCSNTSEIYEDREYNCLGRWTEGGVMYTYTHRVDVDTYECFAGVVVSERELYIIEAGTDCKRGLQPLAHGMKLVQQANCSENKSSVQVYPLRTSSTTPPPLWWRTSPKSPWYNKNSKPTKKPFWRDQGGSFSKGTTVISSHILSLLSLIVLSLYAIYSR